MLGVGSVRRQLGQCCVALALLSCASPNAREPVDPRVGRDGGLGLLRKATSKIGAALQGSEAQSPSATSCPSSAIPDPLSADRTACTFGAGASAEETFALTPPERAEIPLRNVIIMMKENRSYDHLFGRLEQRGQPDSEPEPDSFMNLNRDGKAVYPYHAPSTCLRGDPKHQWAAMHAEVNGGAMDGFARVSYKDWVMSFFDDRDVPFYYFLANTFAIADRDFSSVRGGTWPNRDYLLLGTSDQVTGTKGGYPSPSLPTVFHALTARGISWGVYTVQGPFEGALDWRMDHAGVSGLDAFFTQLADGTLPQVVFVDSDEGTQDEHPPADIQVGEAWTRNVYEVALRSPLWRSLVIILTYDEAGGFADHVPPPSTCVGRPEDSDFFELGVRVPLVVISRWARQHYVSHVQHEHTSILRFIELLFDLPALTARDANSDALLDMFDFQCPNDAIPEAPAAGTGGCK